MDHQSMDRQSLDHQPLDHQPLDHRAGPLAELISRLEAADPADAPDLAAQVADELHRHLQE